MKPLNLKSTRVNLLDAVLDAAGSVILGKERELRLALTCLLARGHLLIEDLPGVGKTTLAHLLARLLGLQFSRIQFTSDLLPADVVGVSVYERGTESFRFHPGPLFSQVVLADEINRATPQAQSALLEAMEERQVTVDGTTYPLPEPFFVIATQNPAYQVGTFPLPESQLDRFLLRLTIGYPDPDEERQVLRAYDHPGGGHAEAEKAVEALPEGLVDEARAQAAQVVVSDAVYSYVVAIAAASRSHSAVSLGLSTRGALALMRCARVEAALRSSDYVTPDHVKAVTRAVVAHRLILTPEAMLEGMDGDSLTDVILGQVPVPRDSA